MSDIVQCGFCGRVYVGGGAIKLCNVCREDLMMIYEAVRAMVRDNPNRQFGIDEAAARLRVDSRKIHFLVANGFVELASAGLK